MIEAWYQGLDALAITGHRQTQDARWGRWFSEKIGGPIVLVGEEIPEIPQHVTDAHSSSRSSRGVPMRRGSARPTSRDRDAEADGRLRTMASTEYPMPVLDRLSQILGIAEFALLVITRLR